MAQTNLILTGTIIRFVAEILKENRHYMVNVTAANAAGQATSFVTLSKNIS